MKAGLYFTALALTIIGCSTVQATMQAMEKYDPDTFSPLRRGRKLPPITPPQYSYSAGSTASVTGGQARADSGPPAQPMEASHGSSSPSRSNGVRRSSSGSKRFSGEDPARRYTEAQAAELQKSILQHSPSQRNHQDSSQNQPLSRSSSSSSYSSSSSFKSARGSGRSIELDNSGPLVQSPRRNNH